VTPKAKSSPASATPVSAKAFPVDSPLDTYRRGEWTTRQCEQFDAAQILFPSSGDLPVGDSPYTALDFIKEAVTFLSPHYSARQKASIAKNMCKQYEYLLVDLQAPSSSTWTEALENVAIKHALDHFLKIFAKAAYAKTLTTHRTSIRSIFHSGKKMTQQHLSTPEALPLQVSPFSTASTPASKVFDPFVSSSPLQHRTPFTPFSTSLTLKMNPVYRYPLAPEEEAIQFFDNIFESRTQCIINMEFKLEYLDKQCAKKDAHIAELEGKTSRDATSDGSPTQFSERDNVFDGLKGDMVLDKLQHLTECLAKLRHEVECTELLIELKDMRIVQLQVSASAEAALNTARETDLAVEELRIAQIQEEIEQFEMAEIDGSRSDLMTAGTSSPASSTETSIIMYEGGESDTSTSPSLALEPGSRNWKS
jgi:hypothetical protein